MAKIAPILCLLVFGCAFATPGLRSRGAERGVEVREKKEPERKIMQFYADEQFNIEGTDTVVMLRNVVLHHNGAVVTCDSAVRHSENKFECFGNVIINQDSTYIYCRRASYDRLENTARVFDRLVKIVSGSSVLYTYNFSFNTLDNMGRYWGGGTMLQDSNRMESDRGWYHTGTRNIYAAGKVQMRSPEYRLTSDSVRYNTDSEEAEFYALTYIWGKDGDMLSGRKGVYYHINSVADLTEDAYVLTGEQELWADSLVYNVDNKDAVGRRNVQLRDNDQRTMAFGDYGEWYGGREEGFLTLEPSVVGWDDAMPADTVYMRADSMFLYSVPWDSVLMAKVAEHGSEDDRSDEITSGADSVRRDSIGTGADSVLLKADTIAEPAHDSLQRMVRAYRGVRIWRKDFQAICDSMVGFSKDSTAHMYLDPIMWHQSNQITANAVDIFTRHRQLDRALFTGDPLMVSEVEGARYNQIKGLEMEAFFRNNELWRHHVEGNAQTLYYLADEEDDRPHTLMTINSKAATFLIDSQRVVHINWGGKNDFVGFPLDQIPEKTELFLKGFRWEASRRPSRSDVFTREIKPSRAAIYRDITPPDFPLTQKIEAHKTEMIGARLWEERYELLPQAALEWLRTQGLRPE